MWHLKPDSAISTSRAKRQRVSAAMNMLQQYDSEHDSDDAPVGPGSGGAAAASGEAATGQEWSTQEWDAWSAGQEWSPAEWDAWYARPKRIRSWDAHLRRKEKRSTRANTRAREDCSPEKQARRQARQALQLQQKEAARSRHADVAAANAAAPEGHAQQGSASLGPMFSAAAAEAMFEAVQCDSDSESDGREPPPPPPPCKATPAPPVHKTVQLQTVHCDDHIELVWKNCIAFPPGCQSFVDAFDTKSSTNHILKVPKGKCFHAVNSRNEEIYAVEGEGAQTWGLDVEELYHHIQNLPDVAATNMATGEYRGVNGYGFVGGVGLRYLYTAKAAQRQEKVGPWACRKGREQHAKSILHWVQKGGKAIVGRIETWGRRYKGELQLQRALMDRICCHSKTASHTFPSAQVGINGGYGVHKDKRDCRRTVWLVSGTGALVFPEYEHILYLHPGDLVIFNGQGEWHANMVNPMMEQRRQIVERICAPDLRSDLKDEAGEQLPDMQHLLDSLHRYVSHHGSSNCTIPQLDGDDEGNSELHEQVERTAGEQRRQLHRMETEGMTREQRATTRAEMRAELRQQRLPPVAMQQIVCYYFQRQQRSYFKNHAEREDPNCEPINLDDYEYAEPVPESEQSAHGSADTVGADEEDEEDSYQPCQYELDRIERIRQHNAMLASLGFNNTTRRI